MKIELARKKLEDAGYRIIKRGHGGVTWTNRHKYMVYNSKSLHHFNSLNEAVLKLEL